MRSLASAFRFTQFLPVLLAVVALSAYAQREVLTTEDAKSTLLGAILQNTTWPNEDTIERFIIGFYGEDAELFRVVSRDAARYRIRGKPVGVSKFTSLDAARAAHILLLQPSANDRLADINRTLRGSQTLVVTDDADDRDNIMVNFTRPSKLRVAFDINAANIINAGLTPSREILLFGGDKVGIADVYAQTEEKLSEARAVASEQERQLAEQDALLAEQKTAMANNRRELAALESQLQGVQQILREFGEFSKTASQAVGYQEVKRMIDDEWDLPTTIERTKIRTRQFAKRQDTWFRSLTECRKIPRSENDTVEDLVNRIANSYAD